MAKPKYYSLDKIDALEDCHYKIILSERSNGKSYAVASKCIREAYNDPMKKYIYLRRWEVEIQPKNSNKYYRDKPISAITNNEYDGAEVYNGCIYLTKFNEETKKSVKGMCIGYVMAMTQFTHYKSGAFPDVANIIFEEFISDKTYLSNDEPVTLANIISTVGRLGMINVYLLGNKISRVCPYFRHWQLKKIPKQKPGTIDIYEQPTSYYDEDGNVVHDVIKIAVENAEVLKRGKSMFFGSVQGSVDGGSWVNREYPKLHQSIYDFKKLYTIYFDGIEFRFKIHLIYDTKTKSYFIFIEPKQSPIRSEERVFGAKPIISNRYTKTLKALNDAENLMFDLLKNGAVFYADDLTGGDFEDCWKLYLQSI